MKFAQYLDRNAVEEWRRAYINYRGLKKLIKRVAAHHRQRLIALADGHAAGNGDLGLQYQGSSKGQRQEESFGALRDCIKAAQEGTSTYGSTGSTVDLAAMPPPLVEIPSITLEGTGLKLSAAAQAKLKAGGGRLAKASPTSAVSPQLEGDASNDVEQSAEAAVNFGQPSTSKSHEGEPKKGHKKLKKTKHFQVGYEEYVKSLFDPSEMVFFLVLDSELERIETFYEKELAEAQTRFSGLVEQLKKLAEHRRLHKQTHKKESIVTNEWLSRAHLPTAGDARHWFAGKGKRRQSDPAEDIQPHREFARRRSSEIDGEDLPHEQSDQSAEDEGARRRAEAIKHMQELTAPSDEEDGGVQHSRPSGRSVKQDLAKYRSSRQKVKQATLELYRGLELLRSFQVLNRDGLGKALKKFDKTLGTQASQRYWQERIEPSILVQSHRTEALLRSTEDAYAGFFEHGDRKQALDRLRRQGEITNTLRTHHGSAAKTGFFMGITLCAFVGGLVEAMKPERQAEIPSYQALLRVYGALFLPVFFSLLFGINLAIFARARISTTFIFEWDPRSALDYHQYFEMPALLLLVLSIFFWVSFLNPFPEAIAPTTWPLVWLILVVIFLIFPLRVFHLESRYWFIRSIARVFGFGFLVSGTVEFRDFFLGDELNSIAWSISSLWFFGCEYQRRWDQPQCEPNETYWTAILSSLPALLRLGQCVRRFVDSKFFARVHLLNAAKYSTSVLFYFFYIHWRMGGSEYDGDLALWICFACIASASTMSWDILMDWSLLHPRAKFPWLRDDLVFESVWPLHYVAIVINVILRCAWIIYLLPGSASTLTRSFVVALLEVLRRFQWNILRIANEHQANVDQYRALRDTPLPYTVPKASGEDVPDNERKQNQNLSVRLRKWQRAGDSLDLERVSASAAEQAASVQQAVAESIQSQMPDSKASAFFSRVQNFLVPDQGGWSARGHRLDDESAAKGAMGRDYAPRAQEADADSDEEDDGDDSHSAANTDEE
ncbi:unnamed protein product [Jaminaea pallidilutea]